MGTMTYDSKLVATFDDRVLAHLQVVIWAKLRRGESFSFTWTDSQRGGMGRCRHGHARHGQRAAAQQRAAIHGATHQPAFPRYLATASSSASVMSTRVWIGMAPLPLRTTALT